MNGFLTNTSIVLSLIIAGWALIATVRAAPPDRFQFAGLGVLEVVLLALAITTVITWIGGESPAEIGTFIGYLATLIFLPPLAGVLAWMEPTRWGSVIVMSVCLVLPVVVVRLQQTWEYAGV